MPPTAQGPSIDREARLLAESAQLDSLAIGVFELRAPPPLAPPGASVAPIDGDPGDRRPV